MVPNPYLQRSTDNGDFGNNLYYPYISETEPLRMAGTKRSADQMEPWNPEGAHSGPHKDVRSVFLPPYGPMADYDDQQQPLISGPSPKRLHLAVKDNQGVKPAQRGQSQDIEWEHHWVGDGALRTSKEGAQLEKKIAKRHGPLEFEAAKKAAIVRIVGACWCCWNRKRKVRLQATVFACCKLTEISVMTKKSASVA